MIHQQVRAKKMIVLVYSCLLVLLAAWLKLDGQRPGLHSRMYVPLLKKKNLDVDIVKSEAIPKSKHRNSMQLQSPGFTTESSHKNSCVWECYGKEAVGVPHSKKKLLEFPPYSFHVKKIGPKNPAHFLGILGRCPISVLQLSFSGNLWIIFKLFFVLYLHSKDENNAI